MHKKCSALTSDWEPVGNIWVANRKIVCIDFLKPWCPLWMWHTHTHTQSL